MKKLYRINISRKKFVLINILSEVKTDIANHKIAIFEFDGLMKKNSNIEINRLVYDALNKTNGYVISFSDLSTFAENIEQTYDLILAANKLMASTFKDNDKWRSGNNLVIEMLDCGDWEISSTNATIIKKLQHMKSA